MTGCGKFEQRGCGVGERTAAFPDQATSGAGSVGEQPHGVGIGAAVDPQGVGVAGPVPGADQAV